MAVLLCSLAVAAGIATAATPAGGGGGGGGVGTPSPPSVSDVRCKAKCAGLRKAVVGSKIVVSGRHLKATDKVLFTARHGRVAVKPDSRASGSVTAEVPKHATTGAVRIRTGYGSSATSRKALRIVDHLPPAATFKLRKADASPSKAYFDGAREPRVRYLFRARGATDLRIEAVRKHGHQVVRTWVKRGVEPNTVHNLSWDGRSNSGKPAPNGHYRFRIGALSGSGVDSTRKSVFSFHGNEFPVRGPHTYGDGLGAGRGHQGQDLLTKCGTKIVAARAGRVYFRRFQSAAGNYVVINVSGGRSMVYEHLLHPAIVKKGQHVHTGQKIGLVGQTGDATACHLHFELWSKPGWYQGGSVMNPTPFLKTWDRWS